MKTLKSALAIGLGVLATAVSVHATPYASGVVVNGGTVTWHLNESVTNGVVAYLFNVNGSSYAASNYVGGSGASPVNQGPQTFNLGGFTNFQIYVFNVGTGSPHQISPNPSTNAPLLSFNGPRGVGVNRNPNSTNFGTIYVANASPGNTGIRTTAQGVFALKGDFTDAFGYGASAMPTVGTNAGQLNVVGMSTTYGVYRVFVGPDDMVYIAGGSASTTTPVGAGVWMCPPNLSVASNLFPFNTNGFGTSPQQLVDVISTPVATGSYAAGTLTLYLGEWDRSGVDALGNASAGYQSVWYYPFYTNTPAPNTPIPLPWNISNLPYLLPSANSCGSTYGYPVGSYGSGNPNLTVSEGIPSVNTVLGDIYMAPDGKFFCSEERLNTSSQTLWVYDSATNGNCLLWDSLDYPNNGVTAPDPFSTVFGIAVSPDDNYLAMGCIGSGGGNTSNNGKILVVSLDAQPANTGTTVAGLPDVTTLQRVAYGSGGDTVRGVAWDSADNFYGVSGSDDSLRAFSLGLTTTTVTGNDTTGTNATFSYNTTAATVSVTAANAMISQANPYGNPTSTTFNFTRTGSTAGSLTVFYTMSGTATNGSTYTLSPSGGSVTIPAGSSTAAVTITPNGSIGTAQTLTATLTINGNAAYSPAPPSSATVSILNTGPQALAITGIVSTNMYRGVSNDFASFTVTRYGDINVAPYTIPTNAFTLGGTATPGVDYLGVLSAVVVNSGDVTETVQVGDPVVTGVYHGNETITVALNGNAGQTILGSSQTPTLILVDNMDPPAPLLWSDTLQLAADSVNWTLTFANSNLGSMTVPPIVIPNYPNYTASNVDMNPLDDFDVEFGYNLADDGVVPSPLMILSNEMSALKMTVNKNPNYVNGHGASAGVNVYPQGHSFSGNYAFRFSMCLSEGSGNTTEYNLFGINHYGTNCNWWAADVNGTNVSSTTNCDGLWYWVDADIDGTSGINTYTMVFGPPLPNSGWQLTGQSALALNAPYNTYFKNPIPYNSTPAGGPSDWANGGTQPVNAWADVEVKQVNNIVTMSINKNVILKYTNATNAMSGDIMLGYDDPFASIGTIANNLVNGGSPPYFPGASVFYANARVVQLTPPKVTSSAYSGTTLTITFTDSDTDDTPSSFALYTASALTGPFTLASGTTFTQSTNGVWTAAVTATGAGPKYFSVVRLH